MQDPKARPPAPLQPASTVFERDLQYVRCSVLESDPLADEAKEAGNLGDSMEKRGYYIQGVLGEGGFGKVYLAEFRGEAQFTRPVAVKLLIPRTEMHPEIERRLRDEGRILGQLNHPNIVQAIDITRLHERWAVVMEFVAGADLASLQERVGAIPLGPALEIVGEVADALHQAHTQTGPGGAPLGLIHRDIKPQNIRLTPHGKIKVLDFGIARAAFPDREAKTSSHFYGTLSYTAPERFEQGDVPESDVYSLAVVLYELISGTTFGKASADPNKHSANVTARLERLRQGGAPDEIVSFLQTSLAYEPTARPSAKAFRQGALQLLRVYGELSLSDWTEQIRHLLPAQPQLGKDELCGRVLTARTSTISYREPLDSGELSPPSESKELSSDRKEPSISMGGVLPAAPSLRERGPGKGLIAGGMLLLLGGGTALATLLIVSLAGASYLGGWWPGGAEPVVAEPEPIVPEPVVEIPASPAPAPAPPPRAQPEPAPAPSPAPDPLPAPVQPRLARVSSEWPVRVVDLATGQGKDARSLAAGVYRIEAQPHGSWLTVKELELRPGEHHVVRCDPDPALARCWLVKEGR